MTDDGLEYECEAWHYTAANNVHPIMQEGLVPYPLKKSSIADFGTEGIFVWPFEQSDEDHAAMVLDRCVRFGVYAVAVLHVTFPARDLMRPPKPDDRLELTHDKSFVGELTYHEEGEPMWVVTRRIPPERIKVETITDVLRLITRDRVWSSPLATRDGVR